MRLRPRLLAAAAVLVVAAVVCGRWLTRDGGPTFRGEPVSHWFPRILPDENQDRSEVLATLAKGGSEVVPLLVAAARIEDGRLARRYQRWQPRLPTLFSKRLPTLRYAASIQQEVAGVVWRMPVSEAVCHALTNALPELPEFLQGQVVRWMARATDHESIVGPCLLRALNGTHDALVIAAAQSMLRLPQARDQEAAMITRQLARRPDAFWTNRWAPSPITIEIAQLGVRAVGAEEWMRRWLASSNSQLRACAAVTLPLVAPERYSLVETLVRELPGLTAGDIRTALDAHRMANTLDSAEVLELTLALSPFLDPAVSETNLIRGIPVELQPPARNALVYAVMDLVGYLGPEGAPMAPSLAKAFAGREKATFGPVAAKVLARLGPVAPETIPDLLTGLDHPATAPTLVLLLTAYGREARSAVPRLREMAAGKLGFVDATGPQLSPALARRYGLRTLPDSLQADGVVVVWPELAWRVGLTHCWPIPEEARGSAQLEWTSASVLAEEETPVPSSRTKAFPLPPVSLPELAAEALRRIGE